MPFANAGPLRLWYDPIPHSDSDSPAVVLVSGLGMQAIGWERTFCDQLAARGHGVVRYDNRDVGLSTHIDAEVDIPACMAAARAGDEVPAAYTLSDMAADTVALLDHLEIDRAHLVGASMGGMIVQAAAIEHPGRIASITSIMSTTGERTVGMPTPEAAEVLLRPPASTREGAIEAALIAGETWGSPGLWDRDERAAAAGSFWDREPDPTGTSRQLAAIWASGSRAEALAELTVPTLVVHGDADTLVQIDGGERTAELVPDSRFEVIEGMGHDRPASLWTRLIDLVSEHVAATR